MFSYSTGYYVSPPDDQYLKFKNRCSLLCSSKGDLCRKINQIRSLSKSLLKLKGQKRTQELKNNIQQKPWETYKTTT